MKRVLLGVAAALILAAPAQAADYVITGTGDAPDASCEGTTCQSLRAAVLAANATPASDTIVIEDSLYQLLEGPLPITGGLTITGDGADETTIRADTDGGRVFEITAANVALNDVTLHGGTADYGGSLMAQGNSVVTLNRVRVWAGSAQYGGGIANRNGAMVLNESLIDTNQATTGDGLGGGIVNVGNALEGPAELYVVNSTIAANFAKIGGGIVSTGSLSNVVSTTGSTVGQNRSSEGSAGMHIDTGTWLSELSLISDNLREPVTPSNCTGTAATSQGWNVENFGDCGFTHATDRHDVGDAGLATTLADNDGTTFTLALLADSPALNIRVGCTGIDQRGTARPQGPACDAGAFESPLGATGTLVVTAPTPDYYTSEIETDFAGTAEPDTTVEIRRGATLEGSAVANAQGQWATRIELPAADGEHTYAITADGSAPVTRTITVDRTPPETTIDTRPTNPSSSSTATFTYSSSEPDSTFACRFFGPGHPDTTYGPCPTAGRTYTDLAAGEYTFGVAAADRAGNADPSPEQYTFVVGAPVAPVITSPAPNTHTNAATLTFTGTATPYETVDLWRDGSSVRTGSADAQGRWTLTNVPLPHLDGAVDFRLIAGALSSVVRVIVDRAAPQAAIVSRPPAVTNRTDVAFTYGSSEPGTFTCRLVGRDETETSCPQAGIGYTGLADGAYQFHLRARDEAGNDSTATYAFTVNRALIAAPAVAVAGTEPTAATLAFSTAQADRTLTCRLEGPARDPVFTTCVSPQRYDGLLPGAYRFTVRSTDALGNFADSAHEFVISGPVAAPQPTATPTPTPAPAPTRGEDVVATPTGKVLVRLKGTTRFVALTAGEVPLGAEIDARSGRVRLRFESTTGKVQTGTFYGGVFTIRQVGRVLDLKLTEALAACPKKKASSAQSKKKPKKRKLWGDGKGSFRTTGKYSAATVRGTKWLVEDSCAGTLTRVTSGVVAVKDRKKTVLVRAGKRYLAKAR